MPIIIFWIFWLSFGLLIYGYFGYPLLLVILGKYFKKSINKEDIYPYVSMIIAAYNEEKNIRKKLENTLELNYPKTRLEIIVGSDASSDRTDTIVEEFEKKGVLLYRQRLREGKTAVQNKCVRRARGDIIIFSDATTIYEKDIIKKIVRNFADPEVGAVGAELKYVTENSTSISKGNGLYWRYEKFLKKKESDISSLIGVSGCCYAVRKKLYEPINPDLQSDFIIAQQIHKNGKRVVYEQEAICYENTNTETRDEFKMRVRVIIRSLYVLRHMKKLLNPSKYGIYAIQLISHVVLRYLAPVFLILLFFVNILLFYRDLLYQILFFSQLLFYISATLGWFTRRGETIFYIPYYFCAANSAALVAIIKFLQKEKNVVWTPIRERISPFDFRRENLLQERTGQEMTLIERRRFSRVRVSLRASCKITDSSGRPGQTSEEIITHTKDLSEGGMLLDWPSLTPPTFLKVKIDMPIIPNPVESFAKLIWVRRPQDRLLNNGCDLGMAFLWNEGNVSQKIGTLKSKIFL